MPETDLIIGRVYMFKPNIIAYGVWTYDGNARIRTVEDGEKMIAYDYSSSYVRPCVRMLTLDGGYVAIYLDSMSNFVEPAP